MSLFNYISTSRPTILMKSDFNSEPVLHNRSAYPVCYMNSQLNKKRSLLTKIGFRAILNHTLLMGKGPLTEWSITGLSWEVNQLEKIGGASGWLIQMCFCKTSHKASKSHGFVSFFKIFKSPPCTCFVRTAKENYWEIRVFK